MGDAVDAVATWVMHHGDGFTSPDLRADTRVSAQLASAVLALPLISRGSRIGALIALDRKPSSRDPKLAPGLLRAILLLARARGGGARCGAPAEARRRLSRSPTISRTCYNSRYLNQSAPSGNQACDSEWAPALVVVSRSRWLQVDQRFTWAPVRQPSAGGGGWRCSGQRARDRYRGAVRR